MIVIDFEVPAHHPCYPAHFPGNPVVPGALLLSWILRSVKQATGINCNQISSFKFYQPVLPGTQAELLVQNKSQVGKMEVALHYCGETLASGKLRGLFASGHLD